MKGKIRGIVFDVGGVLAGEGMYSYTDRGHHALGVHESVAKKLKIPLDKWFDAIDTPYAKSIEGKIKGNKVIRIISRNINVPSKKLSWLLIKTYKDVLKDNKELYKVAYKIRKNGYKTGILSDQWYISKKALIHKNVKKRFDSVVISYEVGVRKPNMKIYKILCRRIRLKPSEILFIDNKEENLKPARKLGMKTILFENTKQCIGEIKKHAIAI
jgi:putative hydrolase of the HAD superfamily